MGMKIDIENVCYNTNAKKDILKNISATVHAGEFVALLGENGAGKTTLMDIVMGFKAPTAGRVLVDDQDVASDIWSLRSCIAYLSEKVDVPADWKAEEFLEFNRFFYSSYDMTLEEQYIERFKIDKTARLGNMSAGEVRRVQIVAALSFSPELIIVDEITAVLDIVGRRIFMEELSRLAKEKNVTVLVATNILENLESYASSFVLLSHGQVQSQERISDVMEKQTNFIHYVSDQLEGMS